MGVATVVTRGRGSERWWALGGVMLSVLAVGLDITVLSVALPTLATSLHASESDLQWFSSGYALVLAAAMLPAGLVGDRYGRKKVMVGALVLFALASAACAYSRSAGAFIAARVVLGLAGAGLIVMALSVVTVLFSEEERLRAMAIWAAFNFLAMPIGPILGGWLLTHYWWGWVFLMNMPVAAVGLLAVLALVPESRASVRPGLDPVGVLASSVGLAVVTYGLIEAGDKGWGSVWALVPLFGGLAALVGFFVWERSLSVRPGGEPLVDLDLFRSKRFTWGLVLTTVGLLVMVGVLFTMPQFFQGVLGTTAMGSGLRLLPLIVGLVVGLALADRIAARIVAKVAAALGFAVLGGGMAVGATTSVGSSEGFIALWMAVVGAGMGLAFGTTASAVMTELPAERSGVGSGVFQAFQKIGAPFGAAILGSVLSTGYRGNLILTGLPAGVARAVKGSLFAGIAVANQLRSASLLRSVRTAFVHGMDVALVVSAGVAVVGFALALVFMPDRSSRKAHPLEGIEPAEVEGEVLVS